MASKRNVQPEQGTGNALLDSLRELRSEIEAAGPDVPRGLRRAMAQVLEALDDLGVLSGGSAADEVVENLETKRGRSEAGLSEARPRKPERHDAKRAPAGYVYQRGHLADLAAGDDLPASAETAAIAKSILWTAACWFWVPSRDGDPDRLEQLVNQIGESLILPAIPNDKFLRERAEGIERAYEAIFGHPYGFPRWRLSLEGQLHQNARHLEERRLREAKGDDEPNWKKGLTPEAIAWWEPVREREGGLFEPVSGDQMLARLQRSHRAELPAWLSAAVIDQMIAMTGVGRGGGRHGKKSARTVVEEFVKRFEPPDTKKRRGKKKT